MAEINAAWRVLSDPARRAMYDASLRTPDRGSAGGSAARPAADDLLARERYPVAPRPVGADGPPRFPFAAIAAAVVAAMLIGFLVSGVTDRSDPDSATVDPIMRVGDCVVIEPNSDARKVACGEPHAGVVTSFIPFGSVCPGGTAAHRDRQGMGIACVTLVE